MKKTVKLVSIIIGTLIGAGFASGKEIYVFFAKYGVCGIIGITISTIFTTIILYKTLSIIKREKIENYNEFLKYINSKSKFKLTKIKLNTKQNEIIAKHKNKNVVSIITSRIVNLFLLISFFIMISGFFSFIMQEYNKTFAYVFTIIFVIICYIIFIKKTKAVADVSQILVPILVVIIAIVGILNSQFFIKNVKQNFSRDFMQSTVDTNIISNGENNTYTNTKSNNDINIYIILKMFISAILYSSYNSIILIPVLTNFRKYINSVRSITTISGITMFLLAISIFGMLLRGNFFAQELDFPIIEIVKDFGYNFKYAYEIVIILSIFTSVISTGFSFLENIMSERSQLQNLNKEKSVKQNKHLSLNIYNKFALTICIISIFTAQIGFSNLVEILYPIFGILGLIQIKSIKNK